MAPEAHHLVVASSARVWLLDTGALSAVRPSADLLLATLVVACGPRALAVVLTGRGTGAQVGVRAVACCGGTVFAQDETTSAFFGMPGASITTGDVERVLALSDIAAAIDSHCHQPPSG